MKAVLRENKRENALTKQQSDIALIQKALDKGYPVIKYLAAMKAAQSSTAFKKIFVNACWLINYINKKNNFQV